MNLSTKKLIYISIIGIGVALLLMKLLGAENVNSSIALTGILLAIIFAPICLVLYKASRPSQTLCKPPMRRRIEASHRR